MSPEIDASNKSKCEVELVTVTDSASQRKDKEPQADSCHLRWPHVARVRALPRSPCFLRVLTRFVLRLGG